MFRVKNEYQIGFVLLVRPRHLDLPLMCILAVYSLNDLVLASVLGEFRIKIILTFCQCIVEVVSQICETTKICVLFWWHLCIVMKFCARMRV